MSERIIAMIEGLASNPFPPHRRGLWSVRATPYLLKDRWPEAPFGNRWRRIKARMRAAVAPAGGAR